MPRLASPQGSRLGSNYPAYPPGFPPSRPNPGQPLSAVPRPAPQVPEADPRPELEQLLDDHDFLAIPEPEARTIFRAVAERDQDFASALPHEQVAFEDFAVKAGRAQRRAALAQQNAPLAEALYEPGIVESVAKPAAQNLERGLDELLSGPGTTQAGNIMDRAVNKGAQLVMQGPEALVTGGKPIATPRIDTSGSTVDAVKRFPGQMVERFEQGLDMAQRGSADARQLVTDRFAGRPMAPEDVAAAARGMGASAFGGAMMVGAPTAPVGELAAGQAQAGGMGPVASMAYQGLAEMGAGAAVAGALPPGTAAQQFVAETLGIGNIGTGQRAATARIGGKFTDEPLDATFGRFAAEKDQAQAMAEAEAAYAARQGAQDQARAEAIIAQKGALAQADARFAEQVQAQAAQKAAAVRSQALATQPPPTEGVYTPPQQRPVAPSAQITPDGGVWQGPEGPVGLPRAPIDAELAPPPAPPSRQLAAPASGGVMQRPDGPVDLPQTVDPKAATEDFIRSQGGDPRQIEKVVPDDAFMERVARTFDRLQSQPDNPRVRRAYTAFEADVRKQYEFLTQKLGVRVEFTPTDPYKNSKEMFDDVAQNNRLRVFATSDEAAHPLLSAEANNQFRAVHDYFGHYRQMHQFGSTGEYNATLEHAGIFSKEARPALFSETLGQNAWTNYGPQSKRAGVAKSIKDQPFAEQKAIVLPRDIIEEVMSKRTPRERAKALEDLGRRGLDQVTKDAMKSGNDLGSAVFQSINGVKHMSEIAAGKAWAGVIDFDEYARQMMDEYGDVLRQAFKSTDEITAHLKKTWDSGNELLRAMSARAMAETGRVETLDEAVGAYRASTPFEQTWYDRMSDLLKDHIPEEDVDPFAKFLGATSPGADPVTNLSQALKAYGQWKRGEPFAGLGRPSNARSASNLLDPTIPDPPKIGGYSRSIAEGGTGPGAMDRHMAGPTGFGFKYHVNPKTGKAEGVNISVREYRALESMNREVGRKVGKLDRPADVQAGRWATYRKAWEGSNDATADIAQAFESQVWDRAPKELFEGVKSPLTTTEWAVVSYQNPANKPTIRLSRAALEREAAALGWQGKPIPVSGFFEGKPERSILFPGMKQAQATTLGQRAGQASALTNKGIIGSDGKMIAPTTGYIHGEAAEAAEAFTRIDKSREPRSFSVILGKLKTKADKASERFNARLAETPIKNRRGSGSVLTDEDLRDLSIIGAYKLTEAGDDAVKWAKAMTDQYPELAPDALDKILKGSRTYVQSLEEKHATTILQSRAAPKPPPRAIPSARGRDREVMDVPEKLATKSLDESVSNALAKKWKAAGRTWDKETHEQISDQIAADIADGTVDINEWAGVLREEGISLEEFGRKVFKGTYSEAGRKLNQLARISRRLDDLMTDDEVLTRALKNLDQADIDLRKLDELC